MTYPDLDWYWIEVMAGGIPQRPETSVVKWAERYVHLPGSARSTQFNCDLTPWMRLPIDCTDDGVTRTNTIVKPVQSGGSVAGEIAIERWTSCWTNGDIQYNWEDDIKASERWKKRIEPILKACRPVAERWPTKAVGERSKAVIGMVNFPHLNLVCQGVFNPSNLDSDSIRGQVNEEVHNWPAGMMGKADRRQTAFWNSIQVNISNAGTVGDQLHRKFLQGTQEYFHAWCPGCKGFHFMRTKWEDDKPNLGGLRYNADGCRLDNGDYDYTKMLSSIRFQMPCGFEVRDTPGERRPLGLKGKYGEPENKGATKEDRSFTYDGVVVDYIPFLTLIKEKHEALRSKKYGDLEPFKRYVQERECRFWDSEEAMDFHAITLTAGVKKSRDGWPNADRCMTIDYQQGRWTQGDTAHFKAEIRDWLPNGDNILLYEGRVETESEVESTRALYNVRAAAVLMDSGHDVDTVYRLCATYGYTAIKGDKVLFYVKETTKNGRKVETKRIWFPTEAEERFFKFKGKTHRVRLPILFYSRTSLLDRLAWMESPDAAHIKTVIPDDVSEEYKAEQQNIQLVKGLNKDGTARHWWEKIDKKKPDDFRMTSAYQVLFAEINGYLGINVEKEEAESLPLPKNMMEEIKR